MKLLRECWSLLWFFVVASFLISGLKCEAGLLEEQYEEMLVVRVFCFTNEGKNRNIPIEGARVKVCPSTKELKDLGLSYHEREEAEAAFNQRGVTDENGTVVFDLSTSLYYFNTSIYDVYVSVSYGGMGYWVDMTKTKEVLIFAKEPEDRFFQIPPPPEDSTSSIFSNLSFLLFLIATYATSATVLAWSLKRKKAYTQKI
jgi:hypothetical protein